MSVQKSEIELKSSGKPFNAYLASPSGGGPGVLVLPSWWGLKPVPSKRRCPVPQVPHSGRTPSGALRRCQPLGI